MYLYEAISEVLKGHGNTPMRIEDIEPLLTREGQTLRKLAFQLVPIR